MTIQVKMISSLEKVFLEEDLNAGEFCSGSALRGERFSFQIACRPEGTEKIKISAQVKCGFQSGSGSAEPAKSLERTEFAELYDVGQVPVTYPVAGNHDKNYLRTKPGLFPDPLYIHRGNLMLVPGQWRCLWVSIRVPEDAPEGITDITVQIFGAAEPQEPLAEVVFHLNVIPVSLPEQTLIHTEWFHQDCLATWYQVPVFSEEHWTLLKNYISHAARFGMNMILTPVFTPPLDTQIGGERPTVQLADVEITDEGYRFHFEKLVRFMELAEQCGIKYFEISHLFTQWGAAFAPKIEATAGGTKKRIFGWDTPAGSKEYVEFLHAFLRELKSLLTANGKWDRCWFHISDEPGPDMLDSYRSAYESVSRELEGAHIIDALSDYSFYEKGIIRKPIPANDSIQTFIDHGVKDLWTYYCCGQGVDVSNRFMAMPSCRNRILGYQLFKYRIEGFLHWGFNFWYSQNSIHQINPYLETGAMDAFQAGDSFLVYPGKDGFPVPSIREMVFHETLQDLRALQLLETRMPRDEIMDLLEKEGTITFSRYPCSARWILSMRETINALIAKKFTDAKSIIS